MNLLRIENLSVIFGLGSADENEALKNINLSVNSGDFITLIGSNGAGKTTLYNAIAGTCPCASGNIFVRTRPADGAGNSTERNITRDSEYRRARYIGRIFQNPLLGTAGRMSLADNMMICCRKGFPGLGISLNRKKREYFRSRLSELGMGLENRLNDNVELFSGGQRQALTLLMTVMSRPEILLLDEHTAALDPRNAELVMRLTLAFADEYRLTVIMITHNMKDALETGNRLLMMDGGEIILDINQQEKQKLHMDDLVKRFRDIKKKELVNDELLLNR